LQSLNSSSAYDELRIEANAIFYGTMLPYAAGVPDIGSAGKPFNKLYADELVVNSISGSGDTQTGDIWQHDATDMYIRSSSTSARTLYVANPSSGTMHLDVEGSITVGGTVDGVDIQALSSSLSSHNHNDLYYTEGESDARFVGGVTAGDGIDVSGTIANYTITHEDTSPIGPSSNTIPQPLVFASWTIDDYGHVTNATYSNLDDRYYTETETDAGFSATGHDHDSDYYTKAESDALYQASGDAIDTITGDFSVSGTTDTGLLEITSGSTTAPFVLSATTQGQTVVGLKADTLNKSVVAGNGLSGGGALTDNVNLSVNQAYAFVLTGTPTFTPTSTGAPFALGATALSQLVTGLNADKVDGIEGTAFVQIASPASITAQHAFAPGSAQAPFTLGTNAQGQLVTGLYADQLSKSITAGDGLSGGGVMTASRSLAVDSTVARTNAANTFTEAQTIQNTNPSLYFDNTTITWAIEPSTSALSITRESVEQFAVGSTGNITIAGNLTVDTDTLYVDAATDAVWINSGTPDGSAALKVSAADAADNVAIFRAAGSQSANIFEIQDSSNNGLFAVDAAGNLESLSTTFVSGVSGWRLTPDGSMEVNNLVARGEIRTALFVKDEIAVDTGSHLFAEAARTRSAFTATTGSLSLDVHDPPYSHDQVFSVGDNLLIRSGSDTVTGLAEGGSSLYPNTLWYMPTPIGAVGTNGFTASETWLQVSGVTDMTTYYRYTVTVMKGRYATYPENTTVVSYGQGNTGIIGIFADQNYGPYLDVFIPTATPWATPSALPLRLGRLDGVGLPELTAEQYGILIATDATDPNTPRIVASNTQFSITNVPLSMTFGSDTTPAFQVTDSNYKLGIISQNEFGDVTIGDTNQTQMIYVFSPVGNVPDSFQMTGNYEFLNTTDGFGDEFGRINMQVPMYLRYDADTNGGIYGGTGTLDVPNTGIRWRAKSDGTSTMGGFVGTTQLWGADAAGAWTFTDVDIDGALNLPATYIDNQQYYAYTIPRTLSWKYNEAEHGLLSTYILQSPYGEESTHTRLSSIRTGGYSFARVQIQATDDLANSGASITALSTTTQDKITLDADEVAVLGNASIEGSLTLLPNDAAPLPIEGAAIFLDDATGDLLIRWADGTTGTILAKP